MNKKFSYSQEILAIAVLILAIITLWIYLSVYRTLKKAPEKPLLTPEETRTLNPSLDTSIFEELKKGEI